MGLSPDGLHQYPGYYSPLNFHKCSEKNDYIVPSDITVVKELRSKMLGQHPGYFKAVFLKKTQIIIVSIYEYTVYIMF